MRCFMSAEISSRILCPRRRCNVGCDTGSPCACGLDELGVDAVSGRIGRGGRSWVGSSVAIGAVLLFVLPVRAVTRALNALGVRLNSTADVGEIVLRPVNERKQLQHAGVVARCFAGNGKAPRYVRAIRRPLARPQASVQLASRGPFAITGVSGVPIVGSVNGFKGVASPLRLFRGN